MVHVGWIARDSCKRQQRVANALQFSADKRTATQPAPPRTYGPQWGSRREIGNSGAKTPYPSASSRFLAAEARLFSRSFCSSQYEAPSSGLNIVRGAPSRETTAKTFPLGS